MRCKYCTIQGCWTRTCKECKQLKKLDDIEATFILRSVLVADISAKEFVFLRNHLLRKPNKILKQERKMSMANLMSKYPEEPVAQLEEMK